MGSEGKVFRTFDGILYAKCLDGSWSPLGKLQGINNIEDLCLCIVDVRFCGPATIIFWGDGSKTVVKCTEGDEFNAELGMAMCLIKKMLDEENYKTFKKACKYFIKKDEARKKGKAKFGDSTNKDDMMDWSNHQETEFEKGIRKAVNDVFDGFKKKEGPQSNFDKIHNMTIVDMAYFLSKTCSGEVSNVLSGNMARSYHDWEEWLSKEAE